MQHDDDDDDRDEARSTAASPFSNSYDVSPVITEAKGYVGNCNYQICNCKSLLDTTGIFAATAIIDNDDRSRW